MLWFATRRLYRPTAVFVDLEFRLYVADSNNNRIQRFQPGESEWNNSGWLSSNSDPY